MGGYRGHRQGNAGTDLEQATPARRHRSPPVTSASFDSVAGVLGLQRSIGNQAVSRLFAGGVLQTKLRVGPAGDRYEREADEVAAEVMRNLAPSVTADEEESPVRRSAVEGVVGLEGGPLAADTEAGIQRSRGSGSPLPESLRRSMENSFGAQFGGVRVHTGPSANELNRSLQSRAFTVGGDIFFARNQYQPQSKAGQALLAHELTHTIQQGHSARPAQRQPRVAPDAVDVRRFISPAGFNFAKAKRAPLPPSLDLQLLGSKTERHHIVSDRKLLIFMGTIATAVDAGVRVDANPWAKAALDEEVARLKVLMPERRKAMAEDKLSMTEEQKLKNNAKSEEIFGNLAAQFGAKDSNVPVLDKDETEYLLSVLEWMPPNLVINKEIRRNDPGDDLDIEALILHPNRDVRMLLVRVSVAMREIDDSDLEALTAKFEATKYAQEWNALRALAENDRAGGASRVVELLTELVKSPAGQTGRREAGMEPSSTTKKQKLGENFGKGVKNISWEDYLVKAFVGRGK